MAHCEGQIFQKQSRLMKRGQIHHHLLNSILIMRTWDKKRGGEGTPGTKIQLDTSAIISSLSQSLMDIGGPIVFHSWKDQKCDEITIGRYQ